MKGKIIISGFKMHCRLGFLNIVVSHKDIVTVSQYHRYRKILARATQELLFTDIFEPGERERTLH